MNKAGNPVVLVLTWAGRHRKHLVASIVCATLSGLMVAVPYFAVFDLMRAVHEGRCTTGVVAVDAAVLVAGTLLRHTMFGVSNALAHKGAYGALFDVRCRILDRLARAPLGELDERSTGRVKTVLSDDVERLELLLAHNLPEAFMYVSGPVAALVFLLTANVPLALVTLVPAVIAFAVLARLFRTVKGIMPRATKSLEDMNTVMVEYITGMRVIKALDMGARSFTRFRAAVDEEYEVWGEMSRRTGPGFAAYVVVIKAGLLLMVPLGALMLTRGAINASTYLLFAFVGSLYLTEIRLLQDFSNKLSQASAGAARVRELLEVPVFGAGAPFPQVASIRLDDVSFAYGGRNTPEVLHGVSLELEAGERLAIVGPSGSGKSTLVQLVGRFYDATSGTVSIGGVDVRAATFSWLFTRIAVMLQDVELSHDSVADNIALGRPGASREQIEAAARAACIHERIMRLPRGYDTVLGEEGGFLSGGEQQRVALARAYLQDAPILVLDEATAQADPASERDIHRALSRLAAGRTVIIIAHRLSTVRDADQILVVDGGRVVERGRHHELMAADGRYASMWRSQDTGSESGDERDHAGTAPAGVGEGE